MNSRLNAHVKDESVVTELSLSSWYAGSELHRSLCNIIALKLPSFTDLKSNEPQAEVPSGSFCPPVLRLQIKDSNS